MRLTLFLALGRFFTKGSSVEISRLISARLFEAVLNWILSSCISFNFCIRRCSSIADLVFKSSSRAL
jgi:hypothetical protein